MSGTAYTHPASSSARDAGVCQSLVMRAPVQSTLPQVARKSRAGMKTRVSVLAPAARASGGFGGMGHEEFLQLRREPVELASHVRFDHAELRLYAKVAALERVVVLDLDAVEERAEPSQ